jgi:plastocyanin
MRPLLYLLIPVALVLTACGGDDGTSVAHDTMPMSSQPEMPMDHGTNADVGDDARKIAVAARSFSFDPDRIAVKAGEAVAIELTALDAQHDFVLDELDTHVVAAGKGDTATGGFTAPDAGTYHFYCSVTGHRAAGMEGILVVS